jgi:arylsulfatase
MAGHELRATVKGRYKRHWIGAGEVAASGMPEAYFDLFQDPHEKNPHLVPLIHTQGQFNAMRARHELFKRKYPDMPEGHGLPYTGLSNARPETKEIGERIKRYMEFMPFDVKEFLEFEIPGSDSVGDWGR